jgi:hypothetical protein
MDTFHDTKRLITKQLDSLQLRVRELALGIHQELRAADRCLTEEQNLHGAIDHIITALEHARILEKLTAERW